MKFYWVKTHQIVKWLLPYFVWDMPSRENTVYLTFDDGPTPEITAWVLDQLAQYEFKASFFCIGQNISDNPQIFSKIVEAGHAVGNHTHNHVNGWHTDAEAYMENVAKCVSEMSALGVTTNLFRPPYGKLLHAQTVSLRNDGYKIIMWDILSADFDERISPEQCLKNVLQHINSGSIIIFHDSVKAFKNLEYVLPKTLEYIKNKGFKCAAIS